MAQVGVDNEPLKEVLTFAYDGTDYRVVKCDTDGNLVAALDTDQNVQARDYGWVSSDWQKVPFPLGYSGIVKEQVADTNPAGGTNSVYGALVPEGEIWVINAVSAKNVNRAPTVIELRASVGGTVVSFAVQTACTINVYFPWTGHLVIAEGNRVEARFFTTTAGDDLYMQYLGVRIDIDQ